MKILHCPLNGPRNISEFVWGGEVLDEPDPKTCSRRANGPTTSSCTTNQPGMVREWWLHAPTAYWFIAERDTRTDEMLRTYPLGRGVQGAQGLRPREAAHDLQPSPKAARRMDRPADAAVLLFRRRGLLRLRRRHDRERARRERPLDSLALVQIPPPARHPHDGRAGRQHAGPASRRAERARRSPRGRPTACAWKARTFAAAWPATAARRSAISRNSCRSASTTRPSSGRRAPGNSGSRSCAAAPASAASMRRRITAISTRPTASSTSP